MKKKLFFCGILAAGMSLMSCSKEADLPIEPQETEIETLEFASVDEMERTILSLMSMTGEQREAWYAEAGDFTSQDAFKWEVVEELEGAQSMEEARAIQAKYAGKLLFNMNEADMDISPYVPSGKPGYSLVLNANGEVEIAGEVQNFNDLTDYSQTRFAATTRAMPTGINQVSIQVGNRKCFAAAYKTVLAGYYVGGIELDAHKKGTFGGWNDYATEYCLQIIRYNPSTWSSWDSSFHRAMTASAGNPWWTAEFRGAKWLPLGSLVSPSVAADMDMYIYSRGTGVAGKMRLNMRIL